MLIDRFRLFIHGIARMMGLDENDLDEKPWKGQVKELVLAEMVSSFASTLENYSYQQ